MNGSNTKTSSVSSTPDRDTPVWVASEDRTAVLKTGIASPPIVTEPFKALRMASVGLIGSDVKFIHLLYKKDVHPEAKDRMHEKIRWTDVIEFLRRS